MKKIKVLLVTDSYYPKFDGPILVTTEYAKCFNKMPNVEAEVVAPKFPKYNDAQPFKVSRVISLPSWEGYRMGRPHRDRKFKKYLKANQPDIIHCHSPFTMCKFAARWGKKYNIPTVYTFHTKFKEDFARILKSRLARLYITNYIMKRINSVGHVIAVSDGAAQCLQDYGYKKPIKIIRNGTDLLYPQNDKELIDKVNQTYNINPDEMVFLSVGRIVSYKKLNLVLHALNIVADEGHNFKLLIVGSGPEESNLKKLTSQLNLQKNVIFTGKIMDREFLSAHYLRGNLFLLPSTFDTASLAPIEAAAMKLPTLMTTGCSSAEILTDNINGLLAEQTPKAWADKMIWAIQNRESLTTMKDACHAQVYRSWQSVAQEVVEYYKELLDAK